MTIFQVTWMRRDWYANSSNFGSVYCAFPGYIRQTSGEFMWALLAVSAGLLAGALAVALVKHPYRKGV